jgi:hypothetical protein
MNALQSLARRIRAPKHGTNKAAASELAALAALPPDRPVNMPLPAPVTTAEIRGLANAMYPQAPTLTPSARDLANTRPFHAPAGRHVAPGTAPVRPVPRHVQQDGSTLLRVRDRLRDLPAAPLSRQEQFTADRRSPRKGGLPIFRHLTGPKKYGSCGLDEEYLAAPPAMHGAEIWEQDSLNLIAAWVKTARIEIDGTLAGLGRHEARRRDAADAALALGYPGEAL